MKFKFIYSGDTFWNNKCTPALQKREGSPKSQGPDRPKWSTEVVHGAVTCALPLCGPAATPLRPSTRDAP